MKKRTVLLALPAIVLGLITLTTLKISPAVSGQGDQRSFLAAIMKNMPPDQPTLTPSVTPTATATGTATPTPTPTSTPTPIPTPTLQLILPVTHVISETWSYRVTNPGVVTATLIHSFYDGGYPSGTVSHIFTDTLAAQETRFYDLRGMPDVPLGFVGDVEVDADHGIIGASWMVPDPFRDIVIVIDSSPSMAFDAACDDGDDDDRDGVVDDCGPTQFGPYPDDIYRNPINCNDDALSLDPLDGIPGECHPFEEVKVAAMELIDHFDPAFDRVAVVSYAQLPTIQSLLRADLSHGYNIIRDFLTVSNDPLPPVCNFPPDPSGCTTSSIGGGLQIAAIALQNPLGGPPQIRLDAGWSVILFSDGAPDASIVDPGDPTRINLYCPLSSWPLPFCRDSSSTSRHSLLPGDKINPDNEYDPGNYDTDDFTRDMADLLGCPRLAPTYESWCLDSLIYASGDPIGFDSGQEVTIFAIGVRDLVLTDPDGDPDAGERTLRYAAGVGGDGDPGSQTDPCNGVASGQSCGNYFYAPNGADLPEIITQILQRLVFNPR